jgi:hypothetical protein
MQPTQMTSSRPLFLDATGMGWMMTGCSAIFAHVTVNFKKASVAFALFGHVLVVRLF